MFTQTTFVLGAVIAGILSIFISTTTSAQCIENPGLDVTDHSNYSNAFEAGHVTHWREGRLSPSIGNDNGNTYAWLWSKGNAAETIVADYPFEAGKTYQISFDIKTDDDDGDPNNFNFQVARYASANVYAVMKHSENQIPSTSSWWADPIWVYHWEAWQNKWYSDYSGSNWHHITLSFTAPSDREAIMIFPYFGMSPGGAQAVLMVDNINIIGQPENDFHFQNDNQQNGSSVTTFIEGCDVWMNGRACTYEENYYIDIKRRPAQTFGSFVHYGTIGWSAGEVDVFNFTQLCTDNGIVLEGGYTYEVKLATQNLPCMPWNEELRYFSVDPSIPLVNSFILTNVVGGSHQDEFPKENCPNIILDASASQNYTNYWVDTWRRWKGTNTWTLVASMGWTPGQLNAPLNLTQANMFGSNGPELGYEYKVKFAIQNTGPGSYGCHGWIEREKIFDVIDCVGKSAISSGFLPDDMQEVKIFPNPASSVIHVETDREISHVRVLNKLGQVVMESTSTSMNIEGLSSDLYFISVECSDGSIEVQTFIKN